MSKRKPIDVAKVEALASRGLTEEEIAYSIGVSPSTIDRRKKDMKELRDAIKRGRAQGVALITNKLFEKAMSGDLGAQIFYLKARAGWSERQAVNVSGAVEVNGNAIEGMAGVYANLATALGNTKGEG